MRHRLHLPLLVSVAAHAALCVVIVSEHGGAADSAASAPSRALVVRLTAGTGSAPVPAAPAAARPLPAVAATAVPEPPVASGPAADRTIPPSPVIPPIPAQAGIRYFQPHEMTDAPELVAGLIENWLLVVPGAPDQEVTLVLGLDERGLVEWGRIENTTMSEQEQALVRAALAQLRFSPARIGRITVRSEATLKIKVVGELRY